MTEILAESMQSRDIETIIKNYGNTYSSFMLTSNSTEKINWYREICRKEIERRLQPDTDKLG